MEWLSSSSPVEHPELCLQSVLARHRKRYRQPERNKRLPAEFASTDALRAYFRALCPELHMDDTAFQQATLNKLKAQRGDDSKTVDCTDARARIRYHFLRWESIT